jgi:hypothetical protein
MFTADAILDAVQTSKKTLVNTFVTNETVKAPLINMIDTHYEHAKKMAKASQDAAAVVASEAIKKAQEATKFDFTKAYNEFTEKFNLKK